MIFLPEQKLKQLVDYCLDNITEDYLQLLYGSLELNGYKYFDNAKELFFKKKDNPRKVKCNMFFNRQAQGLPTIHIAMHQDYLGEGNGLGFDPEVEFVSTQIGDNRYIQSYSRTYASKYNIIFTSDNTFEVLLMYNTIKAFFQGNYHLLEFNGLRNVKFSGEDLILSDYMMPATIYSRGFAIECIYDFTAPQFELKTGVTDAEFITNCHG